MDKSKMVVMNTTPFTIACYLADHPNVRFVDGEKKIKKLGGMMEAKNFDRLLSLTCSKFENMSKDQLADFIFTTAKCANWWYFRKVKNSEVSD